MSYIVYYVTKEIRTLQTLTTKTVSSIILIYYIRLFVYSIFIFSSRYTRSCFAHFCARSKSSKFLPKSWPYGGKVKRKTIHNLVMREIFVSRAGELSPAGDVPKYREPPAQVVRVNGYEDIKIQNIN